MARSGPLRRVHRFLRNPRLAFGIFGFLGIWMLIGTIVPQSSLDTARVHEWSAAYPGIDRLIAPLGAHDMYSHPVFVVVLFVLAASTAVCAWERTAHALKAFRTRGTVSPATLARLRASAPIAILPAEEPSPELALERAAGVLRASRLRVRRGPVMIEASSGLWGLIGSPVFHWALVALLVVIPVGRLTRSEGLMGVVGGHAVTDEASAYGRVDEGPWHTDFTGYEIGVEPGMLLSFMDGEVDRGASPTVTVSAGGEELARQRVYPNNPLRYGPLTIHANEWGYGATYALLDTEGNELAGQALIDRAPDSTATVPFVTGYVDEQGSTVVSMTLDMAPAVEGAQGDPSRRRIRVIAEIPGSSRVETVAAAGEMLEIGEGISLRIDTLDFYARLSVVDDWSVSWMYALFVLACASVSVSVLVPYRVVRILLDTGEGDTPVLRMTARHGRGSPEFAARLREALEAGVEPRDAHTEQPPAEEDE